MDRYGEFVTSDEDKILLRTIRDYVDKEVMPVRMQMDEDRAVFDGFAELPMQDGFDMGWVRQRMARSWGPRGDTGFFAFKRPDYAAQYLLPDRFSGVI